VCLHPSTDSSATAPGHIRWSSVRCRRSVDVKLAAETFTRNATLPTVLLFLAVYLKHSSSQSTIVKAGHSEKNEETRLDAFDMKELRKILRVSNECVSNKA